MLANVSSSRARPLRRVRPARSITQSSGTSRCSPLGPGSSRDGISPLRYQFRSADRDTPAAFSASARVIHCGSSTSSRQRSRAESQSSLSGTLLLNRVLTGSCQGCRLRFMFERFSSAGRRVVVQAEREARSLGHDFIGTEHLMLALVGPETVGRAADLLAGYGLDIDELRTAVVECVGLGEDDLPDRKTIAFTPRSKKVLELSLREALAVRSRTIEPEHVLLGILREGEGVGARLLTERGVTMDAVRSSLGGPTRPGRRLRSFRSPSFPGMTTGALRAIAQARKSGGRAGPVGSQHLLLGLIDEDEGLAAKVLDHLGVSRAAVEAAIAELSDEGTSDAPAKVEVEMGEALTIRVADPDLLQRLKAVEGVEIGSIVSKAIEDALAQSEGEEPAAG